MTEIIEKAEGRTQHCGWIVVATATLLLMHSVPALAAAQDHSARNLFNSTCASCHGQSGVPTAVGKSLNAPDLGTTSVQKQTTAQLQQIISEGKGNMPPFKGSLSESQIESVITYIRMFSKRANLPAQPSKP